MTTRRAFLHTAGFAAFGLLTRPAWLQAQRVLSGERVHTVRRGDTLSSIARENGLTAGSLKTRNRLRTDMIRIGQKLVVPTSSAIRRPAILNGVIAATSALRIKPGRWRYLVTHHSAMEEGNAKSYGAYHQRVRGMENGLAYHFVIGNGRDSGEGEIEIGPRWLKQIEGGT